MKLHDVMKRFMALLLTFALMVGMVGNEALAATFPGWVDIPNSEDSTDEVPDHIHNQDGWLCTQGDSTWVLTCGKEEHIHTSACYAPADPTKALICGKEESEGHTHTDECYEVKTVYTCGLEESEGHKHGPECYGERPLICGQEEAAEHVHTDACYTTAKTLTCDIPEGHVHTVDCYNIGEPGNEMEIDGQMYTVTGLKCTIPANHTHTDACYEETTTLTCSEGASEGHVHTDACYGDPELICGKEESEGHTHTAECTKEEKVLVCEKEETEGHKHTDECYGEAEAPALICGKEETEGHVHSLGCYVERQVLVCGQEESGAVVGGNKDYYDETDVYYTGHHHDASCWEVQKILVCKKEAVEPHVHTAECYEDGVMPARGELICGKQEHVHTDECYTEIEGEWNCTQPVYASQKGYGYAYYSEPTKTNETKTSGTTLNEFGKTAPYVFVTPYDAGAKFYMVSPHRLTKNKENIYSAAVVFNLYNSTTGEYLHVYCSDFNTGANGGKAYRRDNIEASWWYNENNKENVDKLRAIVEHSYPYITYTEMLEAMQGTRVALKGAVDLGQIITATQIAIWRITNPEFNSRLEYAKTVLNDRNSIRGEILFQKGDYNENEKQVNENIEKIIEYLNSRTVDPRDDTKYVINQITVDAAALTGSGARTFTVRVYLNAKLGDGSDITATLYNGNKQIGSTKLKAGETYAEFKNVQVNGNTTLTAKITGKQAVQKSVYFYTPEKREHSQCFIGVGKEQAEISASKSITINSTSLNLTIKKAAKVNDVNVGPLSGVKFDLYRKTKNGDILVGTYTTDEKGNIAVSVYGENLSKNDFYFKERSIPDGYSGSTTENYQSGTTVFNTGKYAVKIVKHGDTAEQPVKCLAGATFELNYKGKTIANYTTDANGEINITGLAPGTYTLIETEAPEGYLKAEAPFTFKIGTDGNVTVTQDELISVENESITVSNIRATGSLSITKQVADQEKGSLPVPDDATFKVQVKFGAGSEPEQVVSSDTVSLGRGVTNKTFVLHLKAGETITITDIPTDTSYTVKEIDLPSKWTKISPEDDEITGIITGGETPINIVINNRYFESIKGSIEVTKDWVDALPEYVANSVKVVLCRNGEPYGEPKLLTADEDWTCSWDNLPMYDDETREPYRYTVSEAGVTYNEPNGFTIEERISDGYIFIYSDKHTDDGEYEILGAYEVEQPEEINGSNVQEDGTVIKVKVVNKWVPADHETKGKFSIKKIDSVTGIPLEGIEFELWETDKFGTRTLFGKDTTDTDGVAKFEQIPVGDYILVESGVIPGYSTGLNKSWKVTMNPSDELVDVEKGATPETWINHWNAAVEIDLDGTPLEKTNDGLAFVIKNDIDTYSLNLKKAVDLDGLEGDLKDDLLKNTEFTFKISAVGLNCEKFEETVTLPYLDEATGKMSWEKTIDGIPYGSSVEIEETSRSEIKYFDFDSVSYTYNRYTVNGNGNKVGIPVNPNDEIHEINVTATNHYKVKRVSLQLDKKTLLDDKAPNDNNRKSAEGAYIVFHVEGTGANGEKYQTSGTPDTIKVELDANGNGQSSVLTNLPVGKYKITEVKSNLKDFDFKNVTFTINDKGLGESQITKWGKDGSGNHYIIVDLSNESAGSLLTVTATNEYAAKRTNLTIHKDISLDGTTYAGSEIVREDFAFELYGTDISGNPVASKEMPKTIKVQYNGEATFYGLPYGTYWVRESHKVDIEGYDFGEVVIKQNDTILDQEDGWVKITLGGDDKEANLNVKLSVTNEYTQKTNELSIKKVIGGNSADPNADWHFNVALSVPGDYMDLADKYNYTIERTTGDIAEGTIEKTGTTIDAGGKVYTVYSTIALRAGDKATITGLPVTMLYHVTEVEADQDDYQTTYQNSTGVISESENAVVVTNYKNITTNVTVRKEWSGDYASVRPDSITVELLDGDTVVQTVELNADNNWSHTWSELDPANYSVREINVEGYTSTISSSATDDESVFTITNTYKTGSLTINKKIVGGPTAALETEVFTFDITGPNHYSNTVTIIGEGSVTLTDLVPGEYHVTERNASINGWVWEPNVSGDTTVTADEVAVVDVTNSYHIPVGDLRIVKTVYGGGLIPLDRVFTFDVTGPNGYSETVRIQGDGEVILEDLEPGTYVVTERDASIPNYVWTPYSTTVTVEVEDDEVAPANFTNWYTVPENEPEPTPTPENTPAPSEQPTPTPTPTTTTSENPNNPNTPNTPDNPNTPNNPNTPDNPVNEQQDYPEQNDTPNNPNVPNAPENQPNMDLPNDDVPLAEADRPNTPDTPVVPNTPNNPSAPEDEPGLDLPDSDIPLADMPPQTGETIMNMVWMSLLVGSGAGMLVTAKGKKREED